ncbi:MAG: Uma2 family endonuclease [Planctomycetales bacterium]
MTAIGSSETLVDEPPVRSKRGEPTWELAYEYPRQGEWTERDYLALHTTQRVELSNGCLEFLPMAGAFHQRILMFLLFALHEFLRSSKLGEVLPAPMAVRLGPGNYRDPDLTFYRRGREPQGNRQPPAPDLAVEIVSPGDESRERDLEDKRKEYAEAGVSEYWIVDPERRKIDVLALEGTNYKTHGEFGEGERATSLLLSGFGVDVSALFAAGRPPE